MDASRLDNFENDDAIDWTTELEDFLDDLQVSNEPDWLFPAISNETILRYYLNPISVMVDPGRNYPQYEHDKLLGWISNSEGKTPVLNKFPGAEIITKI